MKVRWGLVIAVAAITAVTWVSTVAVGRDVAGEGRLAALAAMVRDPLSLLAMRSPGAREPGALLSSKPPRDAEPAPGERVLPTTREPPPPPLLPPDGEGAGSSFDGSDLTTLSALPEADFPPVDPLEPEFEGPPMVVTLWPPWGPGTPGGGGGDTPLPPPPAPAPEPATWAMMILGFFAAGFAIRRAGTRRLRTEVQAAK